MSLVKKANPNASTDNVLVMTDGDMGCCDQTSQEACKYQATIADSNIDDVESVTYVAADGTEKTITFETPTTTIAALRDKLESLIGLSEDDGGFAAVEDLTDAVTKRSIVVAEGTVGTDTIVCIFSNFQMVNIVADGVTYTFTEACTKTRVCSAQITVAYDEANGDIGYDGTTTAFVDTDGFSAGEGALLLAEVTARLGDSGVPFIAGTVVVDEVAASSHFEVKFDLEGIPSDVTYIGTSAVNCGCTVEFKTAGGSLLLTP